MKCRTADRKGRRCTQTEKSQLMPDSDGCRHFTQSTFSSRTRPRERHALVPDESISGRICHDLSQANPYRRRRLV
jgi:hypothetical protein